MGGLFKALVEGAYTLWSRCRRRSCSRATRLSEPPSGRSALSTSTPSDCHCEQRCSADIPCNSRRWKPELGGPQGGRRAMSELDTGAHHYCGGWEYRHGQSSTVASIVVGTKLPPPSPRGLKRDPGCLTRAFWRCERALGSELLTTNRRSIPSSALETHACTLGGMDRQRPGEKRSHAIRRGEQGPFLFFFGPGGPKKERKKERRETNRSPGPKG